MRRRLDLEKSVNKHFEIRSGQGLNQTFFQGRAPNSGTKTALEEFGDMLPRENFENSHIAKVILVPFE